MRGATTALFSTGAAFGRFQSTLLMRGATWRLVVLDELGDFSIHAPHARSDMRTVHPKRWPTRYFNPRSSCEERRAAAGRHCGIPQDFNPRSSCEERPSPPRLPSVAQGISIHAPHARSDFRNSELFDSVHNFNPRSSCEERPEDALGIYLYSLFQSTLLMRGATAWSQIR